ncbi:hypothetical protein [Thiocystis violacea]|uniref:hypothetical protein n=1 Tax=Thiocystis violacea TaxID=13725 RepID=UPI0019036B07|nr:hypothetical protein [Thiocystis violacea]MBK1721981.1 hypothetical protein [Thiocystis violacea]
MVTGPEPRETRFRGLSPLGILALILAAAVSVTGETAAQSGVGNPWDSYRDGAWEPDQGRGDKGFGTDYMRPRGRDAEDRRNPDWDGRGFQGDWRQGAGFSDPGAVDPTFIRPGSPYEAGFEGRQPAGSGYGYGYGRPTEPGYPSQPSAPSGSLRPSFELDPNRLDRRPAGQAADLMGYRFRGDPDMPSVGAAASPFGDAEQFRFRPLEAGEQADARATPQWRPWRRETDADRPADLFDSMSRENQGRGDPAYGEWPR